MITANATKSPLPRRSSEASNGTTRPPKKNQYFPLKLYNMLEHAAESDHGSAVSWVNGGRAFVIHDKDELLEFLLPLFFNQTKFRSFTRQLNLWGFVRIGNVWRHEHFLRGRPERLRSIERLEIKDAAKTEKHQSKSAQLRDAHGTGDSRRARSIPAGAELPTESARGSLFAVLTDAGISSIIEEAPRPPLSMDLVEHPHALFPVPNQTTQFNIQEAAHSRPNIDLVEHPHVQPPTPNQTTQALIPNWAFYRQTAWQTPSVARQQPLAPATVSFTEDSQCGLDSNNHSRHRGVALGRDSNASHAQQPPASEQDTLFVLSGLIGSPSEENSSRNDHLASILSLDEVADDFMNPISFRTNKQ